MNKIDKDNIIKIINSIQLPTKDTINVDDNEKTIYNKEGNK